MNKDIKFAYTGSYTTENSDYNRYASGKGIHVYRVDDFADEWKEIQTVPENNPAFNAFDAKRKVFYAAQSASPVPLTGIVAYSINPENGMLTKMSKQLDFKEAICCLSVHPSNRWMVAADFKGKIFVIALTSDGALGHVVSTSTLPGNLGPLTKIQKTSRPHHIPFDPSGNYLVIPDKGYDVVHLYHFNENTGELTLIKQTHVRPASCMRHIAFHPNGRTVYAVAEFTSKIYVFDYEPAKSTFAVRQIISAEQSTYCGIYCKSSEIVVHPNGKFLYVSNRGDNTIGIFAIDQENGLLTPVIWQDTHGEIPRFFCLNQDGTKMYVGNQKSGNIAVFKVNCETGLLNWNKHLIQVPCPTWILFS